MGRQRVDLQAAAETLGITSDAVRKRAKRGKLDYETGADGRLYVWLDSDRTGADTRPVADRGALAEALEDQIEFLRRELAAERSAHAETRRIAYALAQRIPELEAASETPGGPESAGGPRSATDTPESVVGPQTATERRPWWRRLFS